jgi:hypothetical protein
MVKAMRYRDMARLLVSNGCTSREGKGDHIAKLACLPEGWLQ